MMTLEQFEDCLDRYGSEVSRWPDGNALAAEALLEQSDSARLMLEDALLLDDTLDAFEIAPPSAAFEASLLDLAPKPQQAKRGHGGVMSWFSLRGFTMAAAGLACAAFGFIVSLQSMNTIQTEAEADAFVMASATSLSDDIWLGDDG